jgi:hypothetical protein
MATTRRMSELPAVDEHVVAPGTRYEIEDGRLVYVPPALELHGPAHAKVAAVFDAHRGPGMRVAVDMLTRLTEIDDIAPDVSVYPAARDPLTGGRQIEAIAVEIASNETVAHAGRRAAKLRARGVRRVFVVDVERGRVMEWSTERATWTTLDSTAVIEDAALAVPVPIAALLDEAAGDAAIANAIRLKSQR